jgi:hypothetical protein
MMSNLPDLPELPSLRQMAIELVRVEPTTAIATGTGSAMPLGAFVEV